MKKVKKTQASKKLISKPQVLHLLVKWNPAPAFEPETIAEHARILSTQPHVWWGKISKTGKLGIKKSTVVMLRNQIASGTETHLYLYCPDKPSASVHVAHIQGIETKKPADQQRIPDYYKHTPYRVPFWFKLTDIRIATLEHLDNLLLENGTHFDRVANTPFPVLVKEASAKKLFDYKDLKNDKWFSAEGLANPAHMTAAVDPKFVFVLMPFHKRFDTVWNLAIKPSVVALRLSCKRADDFLHTKDIMAEVRKDIRRARFVIADLTGNNPNVFYELGYAHALGKPAILLTQNREKIPFDVSGVYNIQYHAGNRLSELTPRLKEMVRQLLTKPN